MLSPVEHGDTIPQPVDLEQRQLRKRDNIELNPVSNLRTLLTTMKSVSAKSHSIITPSTTYLPHLDGLRAVALLGVLFFHFRVPHFQGGFLGVDVFLSLSGFLITRNVIHHEKFSLLNFYRRRFYRLYPAAVTTSLITLYFAYLMFPPPLALSTSRGALSSMAFCSNVYFWLKSGYFDTSSEVKPLLHTWSLSLEEQFYLIWPPLIVFFARRHGLVLGVLAFTSLIASFILDKLHPSFAFFQLPSRLFQFAVGALVAIYYPSGLVSMRRRYLCDSLVLGALITLFSCYKYVPAPAPALITPLVTVVASTLVAVRHGFISSIILSNSWVGAIGKLTYSAYLVHWPIYVFALFIRRALHQPALHPVIILLLTLLLALVLQKTIEDPVRRGYRRRLFWCIIVATFLFSFGGHLSHGFLFRILESPFSVEDVPFHLRRMATFCHRYNKLDIGKWKYASWDCRVGDLEGREAPYVVIGDSFAAQMLPGMQIVGKKRREFYRFIFRSACPFYPDIHEVLAEDAIMLTDRPGKLCAIPHRKRWDIVKRFSKNTTFIVANHWIWRNEASEMNVKRQTQMLTNMTEEMRNLGYDVIYPMEPPGLHISHHWLFECVDLFSLPLGRIWRALQGCNKKGTLCAGPSSRFLSHSGRTWHAQGYRRVSKELNVTIIDIHKELCFNWNSTANVQIKQGNDFLCRLPVHWEKNGGALQDIGYRRDGRHLSVMGSFWMADLYEKALIEHEEGRKKIHG